VSNLAVAGADAREDGVADGDLRAVAGYERSHLGVQGLSRRDRRVGFRGLWFEVWGSGLRFRGWGLWLRVCGLGCRGVGFRVPRV
jgi:hypothetical protein